MRRTAIAVAAIIWSSVTFAQEADVEPIVVINVGRDITQFIEQEGTRPTRLAATAVGGLVAAGFAALASEFDIDDARAGMFVAQIANRKPVTLTGTVLSTEWEGTPVEIDLGADTQAFVEAAAEISAFFILKTWPVVSVDVSPVPPRDYRVYINGVMVLSPRWPPEDTSFTVMPGTVDLRVLREGREPCELSRTMRYNERWNAVCRM